MERFCAGDQEAFNVLFARHAGVVRAYLRRLVKNPAQADDLVQLTFLSVVKSRDRFRTGARFRPWLFAIATNAARDAMRRGRFEQLTAEGSLPEQPAPEESVRDAGLERAVQEALAQLPAKSREAIVQHRFAGLSFAEIAEAEGVSESAVKVRAHRGYNQLRDLLKKLWSAP